MKRMFELTAKDVAEYGKEQILASIHTSEGRTLMAEAVVSCEPLVYGVSNPESVACFGADMITLNTFDMDYPYIRGLTEVAAGTELAGEQGNIVSDLRILAQDIEASRTDMACIRRLKQITGRFIGVNLEPVPAGSDYIKGFCLTGENLKKVLALGFDYVVITGNPNTMITENTIIEGIKLAREILQEKAIIIAGKMHGAGSGNIYDEKVLQRFAIAGADVVMIGAPYTLPGMTVEVATRLIAAIHQQGKLALTAMGTSQEGADRNVIEQIALSAKVSGADIIHIGDAGHSGIADPENIKYASIAIRGKRHTYRRICCRK